MFGILKRFLGDNNDKEVKRLRAKVDEINGFEEGLKNLSDSSLARCTDKFRDRLAEGETLDDILPEAFAVVREASRRILGMRHFDVQMMGGICLHEGKIAEMRTGEGKTLCVCLIITKISCYSVGTPCHHFSLRTRRKRFTVTVQNEYLVIR